MDRESVVPKVKTKIPGQNALKWREYHEKYSSRSTYEYNFIWDRSAPAIGPFCTDVDGNIILDFASHVASNSLGYNHPELVEVTKVLAGIDPDRYAGSDFIGAYGNDPKNSKIPTPSHLQEKLIEITKQFGFNKVFLTNTGAESIENAIKICYDKKRNYGYGINFYGAFHGRSLGALSLNASKRAHRAWYPKIPNIITLNFCSCKDFESCGCGWAIDTQKGRMSQLRRLFEKEIGLYDPKEIAYMIIEPIQGEGGYNIPNQDFIKEIYELTKENNIYIISDEVQAGMGRTGKWWGIENFGLKPDIIATAKALRIGAVISREEMFPEEDLRISGTWNFGNAIASATGYKVIEIIQRDNLLDNAKKIGDYFLSSMNSLMEKYPKLIKDVRGIGLMDAMEFNSRELRNKLETKLLENGMLAIGCGYKAIRFLPPLNTTKREIDIALGIIEKSVKQVQ